MLSEGLTRLDAHLQGYIDAGRLPGASVLIARAGEVVHFSTLGLSDRERGVLVEPKTIFRIYSMSKPVTSVALLQLHEAGKLQLDDPVHAYIPSWERLRVYASGDYPEITTCKPDRAVTVRDLLSHQSGLAYGQPNDVTPVDLAYMREAVLFGDDTLEALSTKLATLPLLFTPGARWKYSLSTDVCGYLVERLSGQPLDEYLDAHVFGPIGMTDTAFWVPHDKLPRFAANYRVARGGLELVDDPQRSPYGVPAKLLSGGGGLTSTAIDYWRFAQALCNGGSIDGMRIIGQAALAAMTANQLSNGRDLASSATGRWSETSYRGIGFGLGVAVMLDPAIAEVPGTRGDFSWGGSAGTWFLVDRAEELVLVFMTQVMPSSAYPLRRELRNLVYDSLA